MKLKTNKTCIKRPRKKIKIKRTRTKLKNNKWQIKIEWWNWKQIKLLQKKEEQKSEIKITRVGVEISITKRTIIKFLEKRERKEKKSLTGEKSF
jgi:hypothetical protein